MQIRRDIYPGAPTAVDTIVQGDTITWTLNCKIITNGQIAPRNLTGLTNFIAVLRDALGNPCTSLTENTIGSNIVITNVTQGIMTVTLTGSWTLPFMPGDWTLNFSAMDSNTNLVALGRRDIKLLSPSG